MGEAQRFAGVDDGLVVALFPMGHDGVDESAGISAGHDQTHFTDVAVGDVAALLLKLVGIDRQSVDVAMGDRLFHHLGVGGVVEEAIGVHALVMLFQNRMAQNAGGVIVDVVPDKGNFLPVIVLKRPFHDGAAIGASEIDSGCPSAEITLMLHFDCFPPSM